MKAILFWVILIGLFGTGATLFMTHMPGASVLTAQVPQSDDVSGIENRLRSHIEALAQEIGPRSANAPQSAYSTTSYLGVQAKRAGFEVREIAFASKHGQTVNVEATLSGTRKKDEIVLLGANWDTEGRSPGADDNASGCAVLLEVARILAETPRERTLKIVFFADGAGYLAGDERSGAWDYAREAKKRGDRIVSMLDFDCLGRFEDKPGTQSMPPPFNFVFPSTGNFLFCAGQLESRDLVQQVVGNFRRAERFPCHGAALPGFLPGMKRGDYAAFVNFGYPAVVVTDTAKHRSDQVGTGWDTHERLNYARMTHVTIGLAKVAAALASTAGTL